jgi:phosphoglycolate phosphatase
VSPQLLVFDLDGTLIDSRADLTAGINHMRGRYGLEPLPLATVSGYIGNGIRLLVERSLQGAPVEPEEALSVYRTYYYEHLIVHTTLYDGVAEGIPRLAQAGHRLAVLTNKPGDPSRAILAHFGLLDYCLAVVGGGDIEQLKPDPAGIHRCRELADADPSSVWMIGDHCTDLAAAENAGVKNAFVRYGFGEERGLKPDAYFSSFQELVGYFV